MGIAKAGKPVVKLTALDAPTGGGKRRLGFMEGQFDVPDDFETMGADEIERLLADFRVDPRAAAAGIDRQRV